MNVWGSGNTGSVGNNILRRSAGLERHHLDGSNSTLIVNGNGNNSHAGGGSNTTVNGGGTPPRWMAVRPWR